MKSRILTHNSSQDKQRYCHSAELAALVYLRRQCIQATQEIKVAELAIKQRVISCPTCLLRQSCMQHEQRAGYLACSKSDYGEEKVDKV